MSVSYWAVQGYGINLEGEIFDLDKIIKMLGWNKDDFIEDEAESPFNGYIGDLNLQDIIEDVLAKDGFEKHSRYLSYQNTGANEMGEYLLYYPSYPWNMSEEEKSLTREDIAEMITEIVEAITILSKDEILKKLENVCLGGEG